MEQSVELHILVDHFLEALASGDLSLAETMLSKKEGVFAIGSDLGDWWAGHTAIIQGLGAQMSEMGGGEVIDLDRHAQSEGNIGWTINRFNLKTPDGLEIPLRATGIFHREDGEWKIVHWHTSIGASKEEGLKPQPMAGVQTGARQTMASWAKVIESYDTLPQSYHDFFRTLLANNQPFPYVVLTPAQDSFKHTTTEKLMCEVNDILYVIEQAGRAIVARGYALQNVRDIEVGSVLLHSWLTLNGITTDGQAAASTVEFNSATANRFEPFIHKIRSAVNGPAEVSLSAERAKFDYLANVNFKFMNFAKSSLMGSAHVLHTVWQAEIRAQSATLPIGPFYQTITPAHLTILTDKELILIRDDERISGHKKGKYGGVWRYIPLQRIISVALAERAGDLLTLSIGLSGQDQVERIFVASNKRPVEQLQDSLKKLIKKAV